MALDFQQVHQQVKELGEKVLAQEKRLQSLRDRAQEVLKANARELEALQQKVQLVVSHYDPTLRCALPAREFLDLSLPLPPLPERATILAADGSQITPDRHLEVEFGLINVGAIQMLHGSPLPPATTIDSRLLYDEDLYNLTDATLALRRDLNERLMLADLAEQAAAPVISFTDGPMELWGGRASTPEESSEFQKSMEAYRAVLARLCQMKVATAGYVDKPAATTAVRMLEVAMTAQSELAEIKKLHPLRGVRDRDVFNRLLKPGERSAIFKIQSQFAKSYPGELALHFFYLNVGGPRQTSLARVEIPAWVAESQQMLDNLHAVLVHQCQMMGARPYPYLLHRAHETAVVTDQEREQVQQMIAIERRRRGAQVEEGSYKQSAKDLVSRTPYERRGKTKK